MTSQYGQQCIRNLCGGITVSPGIMLLTILQLRYMVPIIAIYGCNIIILLRIIILNMMKSSLCALAEDRFCTMATSRHPLGDFRTAEGLFQWADGYG